MTPLEFKLSQKQYEKEPVIFFFDVNTQFSRREFDGMSRIEMLEKCVCAIPLGEFPDEWNDTDNSDPEFNFIPDVMQTWCAVSMP